MKLYILANGKDAKGTQLEYLTKTILESLGYDYVATNVIGAGGDEIDVTARMVIPSIGGNQEYPLICECKAHESPINITDWDKFLGKVFKHQKNNPQTRGVMIALSDANGNVKGEVAEKNYKDVQLLQGKDLIKPLTKAFHLEEEKIAREEVSHLTNETIVSVDLILFEKDVFWLYSFANGQFSIFDKNYKSLQHKQEGILLPLVEKYTTLQATSYKNVRWEYELRQRRIFVRAATCWHLMQGQMTYQDAISDVVTMTGGGMVPEMKDVEEEMPSIPFANVDEEHHIATLKAPEEIDYANFYFWLLRGPIPVFLYNDYYQEHINEALLETILSIQYNLELSDEDKLSCLFILRHSHSALRYALQPDVLLNVSVLMDKEKGTSNARNRFVEQLLVNLERDVKDEPMMPFEKLGLRDFSKKVSMCMVDKDGKDSEISTSQRLFLLPVSTGGWTIVLAADGFDGKYDPEKGTVKPLIKHNS